MHALRHHYASALLEDDVNIRALADFLGHNDPGFTSASTPT
jgi:site-specific recombinase XerD